MRIVFECYSTYCAILCVVLTGALAVGLSDDGVEWVAIKVINVSSLIFGPILFTICLIGWSKIKALTKVCGLHNI